MRRAKLRSFFLLFLLIGCSAKMCSVDRSDLTAVDVVESYLEIAFNMTEIEQKELLFDYTTGTLKAALAGASDESLKAAYIDRRYQLESFSIVERRDRTPRETEITYLVVYKELPDKDSSIKEAASISTENTVSVIKEKGTWYIREVLGNKTSIEFPINILGTIKGSAK